MESKRGRIIAIWGNPYAGKSTIATALAAMAAKDGKDSIIVFSDNVTPMISIALAGINTKVNVTKSIGKILSTPDFTQESVVEQMTIVGNHIGILSYAPLENSATYPAYKKEIAVSLLGTLREMADYIFVECSSAFLYSMLSITALEYADSVIRVITPDLKSISFFDSSLGLLQDTRYRANNHFCVLNGIKPFSVESVVMQRYGNIKVRLPYVTDIDRQFDEGQMLQPIPVNSRTKPFIKGLTLLYKTVVSGSSIQSMPKKKAMLAKNVSKESVEHAKASAAKVAETGDIATNENATKKGGSKLGFFGIKGDK